VFAVFAVGGIFLLGLGLFMAHEKRLEVDEKRAQLAEEEARLDELEAARDSLREWREALETDPAAVEEAIRRKLHWVRPGERVLTWKDVFGEEESAVSEETAVMAENGSADPGNGK